MKNLESESINLDRIALHLRCARQRPANCWFHAKGIGRELAFLRSQVTRGLGACLRTDFTLARVLAAGLLALTFTLAAPAAEAAEDVTNRTTYATSDGSAVHGDRCATLPPSPEEAARVDTALRAARPNQLHARGRILIRVAFHVVHMLSGYGNVSDDQIRRQIAVLNAGFAPHGISFELARIDRTANDLWFAYPISYETVMKQSLAVDPAHYLNLYTVGFSNGHLGYADLPNAWPESSVMHGVVCRFSSLPGGSLNRFNEGDTAIHEVGHYLGLYHTFQDGCSAPGDYVADTPEESTPASGGLDVLKGRDTCSWPGLDPIQNFMDYSDDACMNEFTPGQGERMWQMISAFRPGLLAASPIDNGLRLSLQRLSNGTCRLSICSVSGAEIGSERVPAIQVYATTNLALPFAKWTLLTNVLTRTTDGELRIEDPAARTLASRFYRVVEQR